ncbi:MAG: phosphonate C-P lyase system protein PhnG [Deinococcota bacterium]
MNYLHQQAEVLSILTQTPPEEVKTFTETLLPELGRIDVQQNRTGLVMLPYQDTAQGATFHLGETLVAEALVTLEHHQTQGYAACLGRDLEQALAVAILDACLSANVFSQQIEVFVSEQRSKQQDAQTLLMRQVEATRVEMETF